MLLLSGLVGRRYLTGMNPALHQLMPFLAVNHRVLVLRGKEANGLAVFRARRCLAVVPLMRAQAACLEGLHCDHYDCCAVYDVYRVLQFEELRSRS